MPQVNNVEYETVKYQAAGRAVCPYCNGWHRKGGGPMDGASKCPATYVRTRQLAICVRAVSSAMGGGYTVPSDDEIKLALNHAARERS
jgi:hypothetical protein